MSTPKQSLHRTISRALALALVVTIATAGYAGNKYRTFSQADLAEKKAKPGKVLGSTLTFRFYNTTGQSVNDLHARLNAEVVSIDDAGGFPTADFTGKGKDKGLDLSGMTVTPGDSVTVVLTIRKKDHGSKINHWWWTLDGARVDTVRGSLDAISADRLYTQPNGGNVREYLYKHVLKRPKGIILGIATDTPDVGWIRYMKADRKYWPHTGEPRCLDFIMRPSGGTKDLDGQLRNPHVKKHDNHLLGEAHALKLAVVANDSGVTEPLDSTATLFGDLLYEDTVNPGSALDGLTIRGLLHRSDSALTYCSHFSAQDYVDLDQAVSLINATFGGPYTAVTFRPFLLAGSVDLATVSFLHENPAMPPVARGAPEWSIIDEVPGMYAIAQNFPNPFNPLTTIEFELAQPSVVSLKVYNLLGAEVASLVEEQTLEAGAQSVDFDAFAMPSGVYLYRITARSIEGEPQTFTALKKMVLMK